MNKSTTELQSELEEIISWFESDEADIDQAATKYERGLEIAKELQNRIANTENKITRLNKSFADK